MSGARTGDVPLAGRVAAAVDPAATARSHAGTRDGAIVAGVALAGASAWLVLFHPGFMSADSAGQLLEARRGVYSDWHPPLMAALWSLCEHVVRGPLGMLILQTACFWTGLGLLAARLSAPVVLKACFLVAIGFAPPILSVAGAIWKDVLLVAFLVLAFGLAGRSRAFWIVAVLAAATRHNAIPAVMMAVALHLMPAQGPSRALLLRVAGASLAVLLASLGLQRALTHQRAHVEQAIAMFDLVGIAATTGSLPELHRCFLHGPSLDRDAVLRSYDPRSNLPLVAPGTGLHFCGDPEGTSSILRQWRTAIVQHPLAYLRHRLAVSAHLLGLHDTPGSFMMTASTYVPADHPGLEPPAPPTALQERLARTILALRPLGLFRPYVYVVLALAAGTIAARRRRWWPCCIALSGLGYEALLLLVAPTEEYRYSAWLIVAALTAGSWLVIEACAAGGTLARAE